MTGKFRFITFKKIGIIDNKNRLLIFMKGKFLSLNFNSKIDPLEELYRKPDPTLADGQNLTQMFGRFPPELLGKQIEDIDYYYRSKKVRNLIFSNKGSLFILIF